MPASKNKGSGGLAWTPEGHIVYASNETGSMEIWATRGNGSDVRQLTFDKHTCVEPAISQQDSSFIVFASYVSGKPHIWRIDKNGNNPKQLTNGPYEDWPDVSADGKWVIYHSSEAAGDRIWKVSIDGGSPSLLSSTLPLARPARMRPPALLVGAIGGTAAGGPVGGVAGAVAGNAAGRSQDRAMRQ